MEGRLSSIQVFRSGRIISRAISSKSSALSASRAAAKVLKAAATDESVAAENRRSDERATSPGDWPLDAGCATGA